MSRKVILIVEDDPTLQKFFQEAVEGFFPGFLFPIFDKEIHACEFARAQQYEISFVVLDGTLLAGNGWNVAKFLREEMKSEVPIYYCGETELPEGFSQYMTGFYEKHYVIQELAKSGVFSEKN